MSGELRDESDSIGIPEFTPDGSVKVGLTDEPWGPWLRVSAVDGKVLNPLSVDDSYRSFYEDVKIQGIEAPPADWSSGGPQLVIHHPIGYRTRYSFRIRGIDSAGKICEVSHRTTSTREDEGIDIHEYVVFEPGFREPRKLSRFEFRLRPYRHLVTFENVVTDGPGDEPSEVKVSVETLPGSVAVKPGQEPEVKIEADSHARKIALEAHRKATAIDALPRFYIRSANVNYFGCVLPQPSADGLENLKATFAFDVSEAQS